MSGNEKPSAGLFTLETYRSPERCGLVVMYEIWSLAACIVQELAS